MIKRISIVILMLALTANIGCKQDASKKIKEANLQMAKERDETLSLGSAIMELDQREYDFGTITEGEVVEGVFKVHNKGKVDLILTSVSASCGCTTPNWPKEPIKPGQTGEIKFVFDSNNRTGKQNKSITIKSNAEKVTEIVRVKGTVTAKS